MSTSPTLKRKANGLTETDHKKPKTDGSITSFFGRSQPKAPNVTTTVATTVDEEGSVTATAKETTVNGDTAVVESTTTATTSVHADAKPTKNAFAVLSGAAPAPTSAAAPPPIKFDKATWVAALTPEQKSLLQLEIDTLDESWLAALHSDILSPSFLSLKRFLRDEHSRGKKIFPPAPDVYSWSRHTPLHKVRAVILGQDPYHNDNQAHGLCFSVRPPTPAPPSLKNMYIALKKDYPSFSAPPGNGGLLTPWAESGVLMLNTCLTVRAHEANSHAKKGWEEFTQRVIDVVTKQRTGGVVFLAWGTPAQQRCQKIGGKHLVLKSVHPSPLSARRGFFDCGHFKKANEWLRKRYGKEGEIDWNLNVVPEKAGV